MTRTCDAADEIALSAIAKALLAESQSLVGEQRAGRMRLVQNINTKLIRLGAQPVGPQPVSANTDAISLIEREIQNDTLCAHTTNFLQMSLSRLQRFDDEPTKISTSVLAQVEAGLQQVSLPSE